jgi:hypothetical protein
MVQQFTFRNHLFYHILEHIDSLIPGIRRAIVSYYDLEEASFRTWQLSFSQGKKIVPSEGSLNPALEKERLQNKPYSWISSKIINDKEPGIRHQLQLEDEFDNNVLLVRLNSPHCQEKDLLLLFLEEGMGLFPLTASVKGPLSAGEKGLIGQLMYNIIKFMDEQHKENASFFSIYNESLQNTIESLDRKQAELKSLRQNYAQSIISLCNYYLLSISEESDCHFQLSESALDKISEYKDKFELLERIITNAAAIAFNRNHGKKGDTIVIDETDVVFHSYPRENREVVVSRSDRFARTREILDRYENAAISVLENNLPVTGKNIGSYCSPGISPAAISDAIHKHGRKILTLFEKNPNKWPTIRSKFKPVINLEQNSRERNLKIAN